MPNAEAVSRTLAEALEAHISVAVAEAASTSALFCWILGPLTVALVAVCIVTGAVAKKSGDLDTEAWSIPASVVSGVCALFVGAGFFVNLWMACAPTYSVITNLVGGS